LCGDKIPECGEGCEWCEYVSDISAAR